MSSPDARIFVMVAGWLITWYGVRRRDWPGTVIAIAGISIAEGALVVGGKPHDFA